jgi:CheY-like chemotaxis protein
MPEPRKKPLVLVVDDLDSTRELMGFILRKQGFDVLFAKDGKTAVGLAAERKPAVVLLDILMPGVDGFTVCEQIKAQPLPPKIVLFSALNAQSDKNKAREAGADAFLEKPVESAALLAMLTSILA